MEEEPAEAFGDLMAMGSETTEDEKEYEKILEQLRESDHKKICDVYTKLYDAYYKQKEEILQNQKQITSMKAKIDRFDDMISDYESDLKEAQDTIAKHKIDVEEARKLADAMHSRELHSVESIETMKKLVLRLEKELEARKKAGDEDAGASSAAKEREKFEKEKAAMESELSGLKARLSKMLAYQDDLDSKLNEAQNTVCKLEEQLEEANNNALRQNRLLEHIKSEMNEMKKEVETRGNTIFSQIEKINKQEKQLERRDKQIKDMMNKIEVLTAEHEAATAKAANLRNLLQNNTAQLEKAKEELSKATKSIKTMTSDSNRLRNEISKLNQSATNQIKRFQNLESAKYKVEIERDQLRQQITVMERDILLGRRQAENDKREIENIAREKEILAKNMQKIQIDAEDNLTTIHLQEQRRKQLEHEIEQNSKQINKQRLVIRQMEKEKDRALEDTIALNGKIDELSEEVRLRTADILDLKKALREESINTRKLVVTLDATRTERNMLHKNYTESLDEIQDLKQKLKMLAYQIEQLKEDISFKESNLRTSESLLLKANKKSEMYRSEILLGQAKLTEAKGEISSLRQEEARFNRIIRESDQARDKLMKDMESLVNERDVVGAQLVRRNDEITLLYEKIRILEITLQRGERQYEARVDDIRLLRLEIIRLRKEKNLLAKGIENITDLRIEVFNVERELGRERLRVRALEEALETPLNVHRWRKLQGTDPESFILMRKLRITQKKLLAKNETIMLRDRELKETRNLYGAVKETLALQPSPDIQETLTKTQRILTQRTKKIKCLIAEVSARENQVSILRSELDRATSELTSFKQKYYEMKRALDAEEARRLRVPTPCSPTNCPVKLDA